MRIKHGLGEFLNLVHGVNMSHMHDDRLEEMKGLLADERRHDSALFRHVGVELVKEVERLRADASVVGQAYAAFLEAATDWLSNREQCVCGDCPSCTLAGMTLDACDTVDEQTGPTYWSHGDG